MQFKQYTQSLDGDARLSFSVLDPMIVLHLDIKCDRSPPGVAHSLQKAHDFHVARGNETTKSYLRRFAGTCPLMAACSQKCVQEHINDLPVRQEHVNRFWTPTRYREHVKKLEVV